jgi:hypothetical protein
MLLLIIYLYKQNYMYPDIPLKYYRSYSEIGPHM